MMREREKEKESKRTGTLKETERKIERDKCFPNYVYCLPLAVLFVILCP